MATRCGAGKLVVIAVAMAAPKSMIDRMKNNGFMVLFVKDARRRFGY